ncbi:MAG: hypothetical protein DDT32_02292 [Syntrophomonadaceae bacterium]|nr:hypothetical protein [Bacillota bacterium]
MRDRGKTREELQAQYEEVIPFGNLVHSKSLQLGRLLTAEELEAIVDSYVVCMKAFAEKWMTK